MVVLLLLYYIRSMVLRYFVWRCMWMLRLRPSTTPIRTASPWQNDFQRKPLTYAVEALDIYFQDRTDVYVSGNLFLYYREGTHGLWWHRMSLSCSVR